MVPGAAPAPGFFFAKKYFRRRHPTAPQLRRPRYKTLLLAKPAALLFCERIDRIAHVRQIQALGRANRSAGGPVAGLQRLLYPLRWPSPGADPLQRAHKTAHLVVQKTARFNMKPILDYAVFAQNFFHIQPVQGFERALRLTDRRAEGGEIVMT
jgi:hypothetical protein